MADLFSPLISQNQVSELASKLFNIMDRNGSGTIERDEVIEMLRQIERIVTPLPTSEALIRHYEIVLDTDGNSKITPKDFENLVLKYFSGTTNYNDNLNVNGGPQAGFSSREASPQKHYYKSLNPEGMDQQRSSTTTRSIYIERQSSSRNLSPSIHIPEKQTSHSPKTEEKPLLNTRPNERATLVSSRVTSGYHEVRTSDKPIEYMYESKSVSSSNPQMQNNFTSNNYQNYASNSNQPQVYSSSHNHSSRSEYHSSSPSQNHTYTFGQPPSSYHPGEEYKSSLMPESHSYSPSKSFGNSTYEEQKKFKEIKVVKKTTTAYREKGGDERSVSPQGQDSLQVRQVRALLDSFDPQNKGHIPTSSVESIIKETYKLMGMEMEPTPEDIQSYIRMLDYAVKGVVQKDEFEDLVIRALRNNNN